MTTAQTFRAIMAERRKWPRHYVEFDYLTRSARSLVWLMRGIPTDQWSERTSHDQHHKGQRTD